MQSSTKIVINKNCFNFIRLLAAIQVFVGHAAYHILDIPKVPLIGILQGVPIFFCLSGFLIWGSIERSKDFKDYFKKRILRIYPELWFGLFLEILSIIILYHDKIQWGQLSLFAITQGTILQFWTPDFLREFGCGTPNGSLWTIGVIVQFYILAWFVHIILGKFKKPKIAYGILLTIGIALNIIVPKLGSVLPEIIFELLKQTVFPYFWLFFIGCTIWEFKDSILPKIMKFWWIAALIAVITYLTQWDISGSYKTIKCIALAIAVIGFAYRYPQIRIKRDVSYGFYISHMIYINIVIQLGFKDSIYSIIIAFVLSMITAYISNVLLYKPKKSRGLANG